MGTPGDVPSRKWPRTIFTRSQIQGLWGKVQRGQCRKKGERQNATQLSSASTSVGIHHTPSTQHPSPRHPSPRPWYTACRPARKVDTEPHAGELPSSHRGWSCHSFGTRCFHRACHSEHNNCGALRGVRRAMNSSLQPIEQWWRANTWEGASRAGGAGSTAPGVCGNRCPARDSTAPNRVPTGQWYGVPS